MMMTISKGRDVAQVGDFEAGFDDVVQGVMPMDEGYQVQSNIIEYEMFFGWLDITFVIYIFLKDEQGVYIGVSFIINVLFHLP